MLKYSLSTVQAAGSKINLKTLVEHFSEFPHNQFNGRRGLVVYLALSRGDLPL